MKTFFFTWLYIYVIHQDEERSIARLDCKMHTYLWLVLILKIVRFDLYSNTECSSFPNSKHESWDCENKEAPCDTALMRRLTLCGNSIHYRKPHWAQAILKHLLFCMVSLEPLVNQCNLRRAHGTCQGFMSIITWLIICLRWRNPWGQIKRQD